MGKHFVIAVVALVAMCASASAGYEYALDDGAGYWTIGPSEWDADMLWGNCFDTVAGQETITSISVAFAPDVPLGRDVTVVLFDDPNNDYDPSDAVPLSQATGVTVEADPQEFITFDIPDADVSGVFFVAAWMYVDQGEHVARLDDSTQSGRSWLYWFPAGQMNINNLGSSPYFYNMSDTPFNATWMIRAQVADAVVPTLSDWGVVAMTLLTLTAGTIVYTRCYPRKRAV